MLVPDVAGHFAVTTQHRAHHPAQIVPVRGRGLANQRIARQIAKESMKCHIRRDQAGQGTALDCGAALCQALRPFRAGTLRTMHRRHARAKTLQHRPDLVEIADECHIERSNHQPAAGRIAHQPVVARQQQGLLHRLARYAIGLRQIVLNQPRA